jgi:hypothetical protein
MACAPSWCPAGSGVLGASCVLGASRVLAGSGVLGASRVLAGSGVLAPSCVLAWSGALAESGVLGAGGVPAESGVLGAGGVPAGSFAAGAAGALVIACARAALSSRPLRSSGRLSAIEKLPLVSPVLPASPAAIPTSPPPVVLPASPD